MEIIGYVALIVIGIVLSLIGGGGSLLSMPILVYLFSLDVVTASSYSLFVVGTTSLLGAWQKQKEQGVDWRSGLIFSAGSVVAIFTTRKWLLPRIPNEIILLDDPVVTKRVLILGIFALLAIASSLIILSKQEWSAGDEGKPRLTFLLPISFTTGILAGLVGAGGGFLILPSLILLARLPFKIAVGTTLFVIGFNSLLGFLGDVMNYPINWIFLLLITGLATLGMLVGNVYGAMVPERFLRLSFAWITLVTALGIFVKELLL